MNPKKITYNAKTRNDISNPFNKYSHQDLLKRANVKNFNGSFSIQQLENGRIKVIAIEKQSNSAKK